MNKNKKPFSKALNLTEMFDTNPPIEYFVGKITDSDWYLVGEKVESKGSSIVNTNNKAYNVAWYSFTIFDTRDIEVGKGEKYIKLLDNHAFNIVEIRFVTVQYPEIVYDTLDKGTDWKISVASTPEEALEKYRAWESKE